MQLSDLERETVVNILKKHVKDGEVRVFGSKYKELGNEYSDLDLVVVKDSKLSLAEMADLRYAFEESDLLFQVDISDWNSLSKRFQEIINKGHDIIYSSKMALNKKP